MPTKSLSSVVVLFVAISVTQAQMSSGPWIPLFKGIDAAAGTNWPGGSSPIVEQQSVRCVRVDLTDPDVQLFATPRAPSYAADYRETLSLSVSNFLKTYGLKIASDANFYSANPGGADPIAEGVSMEVFGLQISAGSVVSVPEASGAAPGFASLLFTTNKQPILIYNNDPPGTNTTGIYTAVTGYYPVLSNGLNIGAASIINYPDTEVHKAQPRTAFGVSQDRRYLFLMTIDGRQSGYSDGALDKETALWMSQFGAWDAINMDGGGSTSMYRADSAGNPAPLNHSSYVDGSERERFVGSHFGVFAQPLSALVNNLAAVPGTTDATITWTTISNATSQVEYGLTANYGTFSALDSTPAADHRVTLSGLTSATTYFFRAISTVASHGYSAASYFQTINIPAVMLFDVTNTWKYAANNLDGVNWQVPGYDDSRWRSGPGLLWADKRGPNAALPLESIQMPTDSPTSYPFITYYFRTHFELPGSPAGTTLTLSNYIDDGAVFYLNGVEIYRAFMPVVPALISNATLATGYNCASGDATCPLVFSIAGDLTTNLVAGDNVLAVEAHNYVSNSPDVTFGGALFYSGPPPPPRVKRVTVPRTADAPVLISFWGMAGESYTVLYRYRLESGTWLSLTNVPTLGASQMVIAQDGSAMGQAQRFYRIVRPAQ